jgi:hypothetical protein
VFLYAQTKKSDTVKQTNKPKKSDTDKQTNKPKKSDTDKQTYKKIRYRQTNKQK